MGKLLLRNATIVTGNRTVSGCLGTDKGLIQGIWEGDNCPESAREEAEVLDLKGWVILPGVIDAHVHFRDPGMTQKADIGSESRAALLGGVTSFIDMPNTQPPTTDETTLDAKREKARKTSWCHYGFHLGATNGNPDFLRRAAKSPDLRPHFGGIKVFMGSSTGGMLIDRNDILDHIFSIPGKPVLVHCEDENTIRKNLISARLRYGDDIPVWMHPYIRSREACIRSTKRALELASLHGTRLHLLHITTAEELDLIRRAKDKGMSVTAETSANYLWLSENDYLSKGALIKCNPAVKTVGDCAALRHAVLDGTIDTIGSDHAPHLMTEKRNPYMQCPSGMPTLQESLSVMLTVARQEGLSLPRLADLMATGAARIFGIRGRGILAPGMAADLTIVDPAAEFTVSKPAYKCGWSPYEGVTLCGAVRMVFLDGKPVVKDGIVLPGSPNGTALTFDA